MNPYTVILIVEGTPLIAHVRCREEFKAPRSAMRGVWQDASDGRKFKDYLFAVSWNTIAVFAGHLEPVW